MSTLLAGWIVFSYLVTVLSSFGMRNTNKYVTILYIFFAPITAIYALYTLRRD